MKTKKKKETGKRSSLEFKEFLSPKSSAKTKKTKIIQSSNADLSQTIGSDGVKLLGRVYLPYPLGFGTPATN